MHHNALYWNEKKSKIFWEGEGVALFLGPSPGAFGARPHCFFGKSNTGCA